MGWKKKLRELNERQKKFQEALSEQLKVEEEDEADQNAFEKIKRVRLLSFCWTNSSTANL